MGAVEGEPVRRELGLWEQVEKQVKVRKLRSDGHALLSKVGGVC